MQGKVFSIEEFSVFDGPGIRTSVFLKGCPLRCSWCHNPEGQSKDTEIVKSPNGCIGCGNCIKTAKKENGKIILTEESIKKCPGNLIRVCGETISDEDLCIKLLKNKRILEKGGGITFSGGEPLYQSEFIFSCIEKLKGKLHTAIQTSGFCDIATFKRALALADYFLYDLKIIDESLHKKYTGVSNKKILENFSLLAKSGVDFVVRTPLIPGVTDTDENLEGIARILSENNVGYIELLPYNKMAGGKYKLVMREYKPDFDETKAVSFGEDIFRKYNIDFKIM